MLRVFFRLQYSLNVSDGLFLGPPDGSFKLIHIAVFLQMIDAVVGLNNQVDTTVKGRPKLERTMGKRKLLSVLGLLKQQPTSSCRQLTTVNTQWVKVGVPVH